jgi:hypothetical protein
MTTNVGWNGLTIPAASLASTVAVTLPADPALVQRFNEAMAPQSAQAPAPSPAGASEDLSGFPQATDAQLARLPRAQLQRLQAKWGDNDTQLRVEAKVMLDLMEKPMLQAVMKEIKKSFRRGDD